MLAGCATSAPSPPPPPPPSATRLPPDLRGTWTGTWGGTPLSLLITEQADAGDPVRGVYLGTFLVLGERAPTLSGVMTYTRRGEAVSVSVRGWTRAVTLVLAAATPDGNQRLALRGAGSERLAGTGESDFRWGPQGMVEIARTAGPPPAPDRLLMVASDAGAPAPVRPAAPPTGREGSD
jgi:hypothetical protein